MRVVQSTPDLIELSGRGSVGTPLIVGSLLMCWPILSAAMVGSPPTGNRLLSTLLLVGVASTFIAFGRPKQRTLRLRPLARTVESEGGTTALGEDASLRLVAAPAKPVSGPLRYGVMLEMRGTAPLLVLAGADPARVLDDVAALRTHLPLPVRSGWGLSRNAIPWVGPSTAEAETTVRSDDPVEPTRRRSTTALGVGSAAAAGLLVMEIHGRASRGDPMSVTSIVLPALSVLMLCTLTFISASSRRRVSAGAALVWEWRLGAFTLQRRSIEAAAIRHAELVSPTGQGARHLLVQTTDERFVAFECQRSDGAAVLAKLSPQVTAADR